MAQQSGRNRQMLVPTIVLATLALVLTTLAYRKGLHQQGFETGLNLLLSILPLLVFAFVVAGMMQVLVPKEQVAQWVGEGSGLKGLLIATGAGAFAPGGPYVNLPIALGLVNSGASIGAFVAFLTSWSLWAFARAPVEIGILGWRLWLIRLTCTFFFPPIAGIIANILFKGFKV